jgi:lipopolysaccharide heptosyltransferase III
VIDADARILVINVARIGDTLLTTPVLRAIKAACPHGRLGCLAHPKRVAVLKGLEWVDTLGTITPKRARWRGWFGGKQWDYALVYGHDAPLIRYAGRVASHVIAFQQHAEELNRTLWRAVKFPRPREELHAAEEHLLLASALGIESEDYRLAYHHSEDELKNASAWISRNIPAAAGPLIGFQIASFPTKAYRDWPMENFAELGARILDRYPHAHLLVLGGKESRAKARWLESRLPGRVTSVAGAFDLRGTAALMHYLDLYVGVDTGPTHLAGALGIPMVALYHCYHPSRRLAPRGHPLLRAVDHPRVDAACGPDIPMAEITVPAVWPKVEELLQQYPPARRRDVSHAS